MIETALNMITLRSRYGSLLLGGEVLLARETNCALFYQDHYNNRRSKMQFAET